jgi:Uma2 family endonuclease
MGMAATHERWTAEMLRALPDDGKRYEIVRGELLVTPSPSFTHQRAVRELTILIGTYLSKGDGAEMVHAPADVELEADSIVQPDLFVFPRVPGRKVRRFSDAGTLLLAIEILSPSTARYDRIVKRRLYLEHQIPEYWIVDCDARCIERWRPADERPEILTERIEWQAPDASSPLEIDLAAFFTRVLEEEAR